MTKQESPPYDSEHLTPTEQACEKMMKRTNCISCLHMRQHKRSGGRVREEKQDIVAVLNGKRCDYFESRKQK